MTITNPGQVEKELRIGGGGGGVFELIPCDPTITITGRYGDWINQLSINGETFGGGGGGPKDESFIVPKNDYITHAKVYYGDYVNSIEFTTNKGASWQIGKDESGSGLADKELSDIRVLAIGGSSGEYLDAITLRYLDNYDVIQESDDGDSPDDLYAILNIFSSGKELVRTDSIRSRELEAITAINEFTINMESEITATYMVAEATSRFGFAYMNRQELAKETENEVSNTTKETIKIDEGMLGVEICNVEFKKRKSGGYFLVPTSGKSVETMTPEQIKQTKFFDLSKKLKLHIPDIEFTTEKGWSLYHAGA